MSADEKADKLDYPALWTETANEARWFGTHEEARRVAEMLFGFGGRDTYTITGHMFLWPIEQGASAPETEPRRHRRTKRMDGQPWDACTCGWQANCFSWNAHAAKARKRGEIVETGEPPSAAIEATMSALYSVAVAMHESINAGRGATGWSEAGVREILQTFRADAVREERARIAKLNCIGCDKNWARVEVVRDGLKTLHRMDSGDTFFCKAVELGILEGE